MRNVIIQETAERELTKKELTVLGRCIDLKGFYTACKTNTGISSDKVNRYIETKKAPRISARKLMEFANTYLQTA